MKRSLVVFLFVIFAYPLVTPAQQASKAEALTDQQKLGQRVFEQRCSVCHRPAGITSNRTYGPALYKDLIEGNEDTIREFINNGSSGRMPGFKHTLESAQIDAIIEYLKTVERLAPPRTPGGGNPQNVPVD